MLVTAGFGTDGGSAVWFQPIVVTISVPAEETGQVDLGMFFNCASDARSGETCWYACQSQHSDCHNSSESSTHLTLSSTFLPFLGFIVSDKIWALRRWVSASLLRALLKESASNALLRSREAFKKHHIASGGWAHFSHYHVIPAISTKHAGHLYPWSHEGSERTFKIGSSSWCEIVWCTWFDICISFALTFSNGVVLSTIIWIKFRAVKHSASTVVSLGWPCVLFSPDTSLE